MHTLANIRTFRAGRFTVTVRAVEDNDCDMSFDQSGEVQAAIDKGELELFGVEAECCLDGMPLASDYLGGCIYASPKEFMNHLGNGDRSGTGSYFADMVRNVCREARAKLREMQSVYVRNV